MPEEIQREVHVTTTLDAYRNFFNDDWGERVDALTASKPQLSEIVFDLMMEWRAAAYTASLPVSILEHMRAYHDAFVNTGELNTVLLRLAQLIPGKLANAIPEVSGDPALVRRIQEQLVTIGAELEESRDKSDIEFPIDDVWQSYLKDNAYQLSLWGSQRICFVAVYNSYENFLVRAVSIALSLDNCRSTDQDFKDRVEEAFGASICFRCWKTRDVNIARLARHSLSHAGGRLNKKFGKQPHKFEIRDDRIQVTPELTKELFSLLKDCVFTIAEAAVTMEEFAQPIIKNAR